MSLAKIERSWFRPRIWLKNDILHAETSLFVQICCLLSHYRVVKVYQKARFIKIESKWLWFFTSQRYISFSRICRVETDYHIMRTAIKEKRYYEEFSIFLCLKEPFEYLWLISFGGEKSISFANLFESQGDQEITFQEYYLLLKKMIEKKTLSIL